MCKMMDKWLDANMPESINETSEFADIEFPVKNRYHGERRRRGVNHAKKLGNKSRYAYAVDIDTYEKIGDEVRRINELKPEEIEENPIDYAHVKATGVIHPYGRYSAVKWTKKIRHEIITEPMSDSEWKAPEEFDWGKYNLDDPFEYDIAHEDYLNWDPTNEKDWEEFVRKNEFTCVKNADGAVEYHDYLHPLFKGLLWDNRIGGQLVRCREEINRRAMGLKIEKDRLLAEIERLSQKVKTLDSEIDNYEYEWKLV